MNISTRQATQADFEWLYNLKVASMRDYIDRVYGWVEADQKDFFTRDFRPQDVTVITADGEDAGMFELAKEEDGYFLRRIEIHPLFQNQGIGSFIIRGILSQAGADGERVQLWVFRINPARKLYMRLGFEIVEESITHYRMVWQSASV